MIITHAAEQAELSISQKMNKQKHRRKQRRQQNALARARTKRILFCCVLALKMVYFTQARANALFTRSL